ncbi:MAG: GNAT family N-acetyltransferase [Armatimonadia bacterium]
MFTLRAAAAAVRLTDDNMEQLRSKEAVFTRPYEGEFRAAALVIEGDQRVALVSVDALLVPGHIVRAAVDRLAAAERLPAGNVIVCGTHTHHAPSTLDYLGCTSNKEYLRRIEEGIVLAVTKAVLALEDPQAGPNATQVELLLGLAQEATIGRNSRLLLRDGMIGWWGYIEEDALHPTGPYDPDLYVLALRRSDGSLAGLAFNHSVHNIGALAPDVFSPAFYGHAAQELERRCGAITAFLPGAFGSTHNITYSGSGISPAECAHRVTEAAQEALRDARPILMGPVRVLRKRFNYRLREFDEAREEAAVKVYSEKYFPQVAEGQQQVFRQQRLEMQAAPDQERSTWLTAIRLGDVALVGVPGEMFARLGLDLRHRSPFRHTLIVGLANDELGYIPDRQAIEDGGYQTWPGWHSPFAIGTGEAMVDQALEMLRELYDETQPAGVEPFIRPLGSHEALPLQTFYNSLSHDARRLFRPHGWNVTYDVCTGLCGTTGKGERFDLVLDTGRQIVGWCFLHHLDLPTPTLGIGLADAYCGRGWGTRLMDEIIAHARSLNKEAIELTVVHDNDRARALYERCGFVKTGNRKGSDGLDYLQMRLRLT